MEDYLKVIKFLCEAEEQYEQKSKEMTSLNEKIKYKKEAKNVKTAQITLKKLHFQAEDYFNKKPFEVGILK